MKEELKEIFEGIFKKLPMNLFCGLGIGFFTILTIDLADLNTLKTLHSNPLATLINHNPLLFWTSFLVGFLWSNSLIKEMRILTYRKLIYRLPILLIWIIGMYFLKK